MNGVPASKHPMKMYEHCPYFGSDQHHVTWGDEMPQQIQDDTPR
jgi:hypothetical protein